MAASAIAFAIARQMTSLDWMILLTGIFFFAPLVGWVGGGLSPFSSPIHRRRTAWLIGLTCVAPMLVIGVWSGGLAAMIAGLVVMGWPWWFQLFAIKLVILARREGFDAVGERHDRLV